MARTVWRSNILLIEAIAMLLFSAWITAETTWEIGKPGQSPLPMAKGISPYFAQKDLAMAREARCGVMFWDGKSKGTLNNIHNLLHEQKKVLVYLASERAFHKIGKRGRLERSAIAV